jgi:predicted short-subunit dehydrogenase-like oxidoreductase (DUF2520 family)
MYSINIIGAGQVGQTFGRLFHQYGVARIAGVCNRSLKSAQKAVEEMGEGLPVRAIADLPKADITLITAPDDQIPYVANALSQTTGVLLADQVVMHCSGSLTSEVLNPLRSKGVWLASLHPMRSFAQPELSTLQYAGTYCAVEGDEAARAMIEPLFTALGSQVYSIDPQKKTIYHVAGVFAANYVVTLAEQARRCFAEAGVPDELNMKVVTHLMQSTVSNLVVTGSPQASLTGPLQRGDASTITHHLEAITATDRLKLYAVLGVATLSLTEQEKDVKDILARALNVKKILKG